MNYSWILLDADNTLFDFDRAARFALEQAVIQFGMEFREPLIEAYELVNKQCWQEFENGQINAEELRVKRMELFFRAIGVDWNAGRFSATYLGHLANSGFLLDGAKQLLDELATDYNLVLITNGLKEVQRPRLERSNLTDYFHSIVVSDEIGVAKPHPAFFDHAFECMGNPHKSSVLVVGDSLSSDITGGLAYGVHTCWYNPGKLEAPASKRPDYQIHVLSDLVKLVKGISVKYTNGESRTAEITKRIRP